MTSEQHVGSFLRGRRSVMAQPEAFMAQREGVVAAWETVMAQREAA
jgi:hypothetical protein